MKKRTKTMKVEANIETKQIIEVKNNKTGEVNFLIENNGNWETISKKEYYKILKREENDK